MYLQIEKEFKRNSKYRKSQLRFVIGAFAYATIISLLFSPNFICMIENDKVESNFIWFLAVGIIVFPIICHLYMVLSIRTHVKITVKNVFNIDFIKEHYQGMIHDEDLIVLSNILKNKNINSRPKVQEALRHYQCMLPRKVSSSGTLLSILAFAVSIMALFFSETVLKSATTISVIVAVIFMIILIYVMVIVIANGYFKAFSKEALYVRLESSLSEIFMTYYLKKGE